MDDGHELAGRATVLHLAHQRIALGLHPTDDPELRQQRARLEVAGARLVRDARALEAEVTAGRRVGVTNCQEMRG